MWEHSGYLLPLLSAAFPAQPSPVAQREGPQMSAAIDTWKKKREVLKIKRDSAFKEYTKHPNDLQFVLEIKALDDEIAECTYRMEQERRSTIHVIRPPKHDLS
jgi:hypothetical protein